MTRIHLKKMFYLFLLLLLLLLYIYITNTFLIGGQWYVCAIFHIPINYLVDNFNKLTQMAVIK